MTGWGMANRLPLFIFPQHQGMPMPAVIRNDWSREEVLALFDLPFPELLYRAATVHRERFDPAEVQVSTLLSVKTGGCPEDCAYCPQSGHYDTSLSPKPLRNFHLYLKKDSQ